MKSNEFILSLVFYGGIAGLLITMIVAPIILFLMSRRFVRGKAIAHSGRRVMSGISLLVPVLCVTVALIIRPSAMLGSQFAWQVYMLLLALFEVFIVINAIILFNMLRSIMANKSGVVTVLFGLLIIVGTLLGMVLMGVWWFIILI